MTSPEELVKRAYRAGYTRGYSCGQGNKFPMSDCYPDVGYRIFCRDTDTVEILREHRVEAAALRAEYRDAVAELRGKLEAAEQHNKILADHVDSTCQCVEKYAQKVSDERNYALACMVIRLCDALDCVPKGFIPKDMFVSRDVAEELARRHEQRAAMPTTHMGTWSIDTDWLNRETPCQSIALRPTEPDGD